LPETVTLRQIHEEIRKDESLIPRHFKSNPDCPVEARVDRFVDETFERIEIAFRDKLGEFTIQDALNNVPKSV